MRHFFVMNPHSFVKASAFRQFELDVERCFADDPHIRYDIHISRYPRDAIAAIDQYCAEVKGAETVRVYAVGGDGILFDCVNGIMGIPNTEIASVPFGMSNDFIRGFGEGCAPVFRKLENLAHAPSRPMDVMNCGANYAVQVCAVGVEAMAVLRYIQVSKRFHESGLFQRLVPTVYKIGALATVLSGKASGYYRVSVDGDDLSGAYADINIGNVGTNGGSNTPNPYAVADDGELNAVFVRKDSRLNLLKNFTGFTSGNFEKHPEQMFHRAFKRVNIASDTEFPVILDGETFMCDHLDIEVIPSAINCVVPVGYGFQAPKTKGGPRDV